MLQQKKTNKVAGFHIEPTNICTLKCAGCARTKFINQWPHHWKNYSLDIDQLLKFLDLDLTGINISLCGVYGDPIYHPNLFELVDRLKQRGSIISIVTNGSYRTEQWWNELTSILTASDRITFSIDGIPTNFTQYRVNADWGTIEKGMKIVAKSSCQSTWKYIPFSFNYTDIQSAERLSQQLGIGEFLLEPSDRFDEGTEFLKPEKNLLGTLYNAKVSWKSVNPTNIKTVNPKCANGKEHFIAADGYYIPCCYVADHRFYYKTQFGKQKKLYNIQHCTFSQLLEESSVKEFYQDLNNQSVCQFNCPG
jgi:MoaA/NifB/PqqE/SkfB family radical SAM enzyme